MFCPRCGQQQASDAVRFCSRCGFQLAAVAGLLATNGAAPEMLMEAAPAPLSPKRKGVSQGGKMMLIAVFLAPALAAMGELVGGFPDVGILGVIVFLAGLFRLLYALLFEDGPFRKQLRRQPVQIPSAQFAAPPRDPSALPPPQVVPIPTHTRPQQRYHTGELVEPPRASVTDHTTRLLDKQPDEPPRQ